MDLNGLVDEHTERFNTSVAAHDFTPLVESFAPDATMSFDNVSVGPFRGKDAIAMAYRVSPPDDGIDVVDITETGSASATVTYVWRSRQADQPGEMRMSWQADGLLQTLEIRLP